MLLNVAVYKISEPIPVNYWGKKEKRTSDNLKKSSSSP